MLHDKGNKKGRKSICSIYTYTHPHTHHTPARNYSGRCSPPSVTGHLSRAGGSDTSFSHLLYVLCFTWWGDPDLSLPRGLGHFESCLDCVVVFHWPSSQGMVLLRDVLRSRHALPSLHCEQQSSVPLAV